MIPRVNDGIYKGLFTFNFGQNGENGFKFWEDSNWGGEYGISTDSSYGSIIFDLRNNITDAPNGDPQFYLGQLGYSSGEYMVTINYNTMKMTLTIPDEYPETLYAVGGAIDPDWSTMAEMTELEEGIFRVENINLSFENGEDLKGHGIKFIETTDWEGQWGPIANYETDGYRGWELAAYEESPQFYPLWAGCTSGIYTITVDFTTMTITLACQTTDGDGLSFGYKTEETLRLYANLKELTGTGTMFGAQMPTIHGINYTASWMASAQETNKSDTKDLTGSHPAVCGWEIGYIEKGSNDNLDEIPFDKIRAHIKAAYGRGAVNTISWHCSNPITDGRYNSTSDNPIEKILPGGSHHDKFLGWLDKAAEFLLSLETDEGVLIPIIFRPWHEHTDSAQGSGFWWSIGNNSNDNFKLLWQMTYDYLTDTKGVHNLIWAYSPDLHHLCWNESGLDKYVYMNAWPGDEYVDILGLDAYQTASSNFDASVADVVNYAIGLAEEKEKVFAITETGLSNNNPGHYKYFYNLNWWTTKLYPLMQGKKVSYAMVWKNDGYPLENGFPEYYNAFPGSYSTEDFLTFTAKNDILLENDLNGLYD